MAVDSEQGSAHPSQKARLIAGVAEELGRQVDEVAPIYDEIFDRMARTAKVKDYLPTFALKHVRAVLSAARENEQ
jgi:uncharacterized protein (DUF2126 family)